MSNRRSPIEIRCHRATTWIEKAGRLSPKDLDGRFIYLWITFNALYGQPKYLEKRAESKREEEDFQRFLNLMIHFDHEALSMALKSTKEHLHMLLEDKYLSDLCWRYWFEHKVESAEDRQKRGAIELPKGTELNQLFHRLYVLRKQLFHGCSSDGGSKNRQMLEKAVIVLDRLLPLFRDIVKNNDDDKGKALLKSLPYPPSF